MTENLNGIENALSAVRDWANERFGSGDLEGRVAALEEALGISREQALEILGGAGGAASGSILRSRMLSPSDYTASLQLKTQTITSPTINSAFYFDRPRYGNTGHVVIDDDTPVQVAVFRQFCNDINIACALPTALADIDKITFTIRDMWWSNFDECEATITAVEPFTTVDGFSSHKIVGYFTTEHGTEVDFAICLGFVLSGNNPTRGYMLFPRDGFPRSSVYFKRTSGSEVMFPMNLYLEGHNATNVMPVGKACRVALNELLRPGDTINTRIAFRDRLSGGSLESWVPDGELVFDYKATVLFAPIGHLKTDIATTGMIPDFGGVMIAFVESTVDENGITATMAPMEDYENMFNEVAIASTAEVAYVEVISRG